MAVARSLRVTIKDGSLSNPLSARLEQCILFRMEAQTCGKVEPGFLPAVAPWASLRQLKLAEHFFLFTHNHPHCNF